jgi:hypothetical protein
LALSHVLGFPRHVLFSQREQIERLSPTTGLPQRPHRPIFIAFSFDFRPTQRLIVGHGFRPLTGDSLKRGQF